MSPARPPEGARTAAGGEGTPIRDEARRQLAQRRLGQFERALQAAAGAMGEPEPDALVRSTLDLAGHAALAVALDPGLLHLLRINFFFDRDRVPHWVEGRLLLSALCSEAEGGGLYVMDATVRELLLARLLAHHGHKRLRAVATLLWQYAERRSSWFDRSELRHAQQLTALNFLAPERAQAWLDAAEGSGGTASLSKDWFVAMRDAMPALPPAPQGGDPVVVFKALRELDFVAQRSAHRTALRQSETYQVFMIRGPRDHAHRWLLLRLLSHYDKPPVLLWVSAADASSSLRASLAVAIGLDGEATRARIHERTAGLAATRPLAVAVDGVERLNDAQQAELRELAALELPVSLYLLDRPEGSAAANNRMVSVKLLLSAVSLLPALAPIAHEDLRYWIDRHGGEAGLDGLGPEETRDADDLARQVLQATDGVPERVLEHLCVRCGVRWPDVLAAAEAPFAMAMPPADEAIAELAREYELRRAKMPSGDPRTRVMTEVAGRMRALLDQREDWPLQAWTTSASPGLRLAAAVLLQLRPRAGQCAWLGTRVREERPFVAYHALIALLAAAQQLPIEELGEVEAAQQRAAADLSPADARTDRGDVLRGIREALDERRSTTATYLPLLPLRDVVLFPGQEQQLLLTRAESMRGLFKVLNGGDDAVFAVLDESQGEGFVPHLLRQIGTVAHVTRHAARDNGIEVSLKGMDRAIGTPMQDPGEGGAVLVRIDPLGEPPTQSEPFRRDKLVDALRALARIGGTGSKVVDLARTASSASDCYRLAETLGETTSNGQTLLESDSVHAMVQLLRGSVAARIEDRLPEDLGADGWGLDRLAIVFGAIFGDEELSSTFETPLPLTADNPHALAAHVRSAAASGHLRRIVAGALASRPDDDALWEHVEAMTQRRELPSAPRKRTPKPVPLPLWPNGSTLHIRFLGGSEALRKRVMRCAAQWFAHANLHYQVLTDRSKTPADIRIAFKPEDGSWSYVGTDARAVPADQPTMNFGWLTPRISDAELQQVVLKQFGHALGLWQEHKNPDGGIQWDREAVMKMYVGAPNFWTREQVEHNVLAPNPPSIPPYRPFDAQSIMLHDFPAEMLLSRQAIHGGKTLSDSDKAFIAAFYPREDSARPPTLKPSVRKR